MKLPSRYDFTPVWPEYLRALTEDSARFEVSEKETSIGQTTRRSYKENKEMTALKLCV